MAVHGGEPIRGLHAAGSCTGGIEGGPIAGYVGGYMKALCLGLIAGDTMAQDIAATRRENGAN